MIKKKYLTEVAFKNGVDEFKSYRTFTKTFEVDITEDTTSSFRVLLEDKDVDEDSISVEIKDRYEVDLQWRKINGEDSNYIEVYTKGTDVIAKGEYLVFNYIALNTYSSDLYSVDYETGTLYLANKTNNALKCSCEYYKVLLTGKVAEQLLEDEYDVSNGLVRINNHNNAFTYSSLYNLEVKGENEYTTPFVRNAKVNYINTSEEESL